MEFDQFFRLAPYAIEAVIEPSVSTGFDIGDDIAVIAS